MAVTLHRPRRLASALAFRRRERPLPVAARRRAWTWPLFLGPLPLGFTFLPTLPISLIGFFSQCHARTAQRQHNQASIVNKSNSSKACDCGREA